MSTAAAPSAAAQYGQANANIQSAANGANALTAMTPPKTYEPDLNQENQTASLLSRAQVLQNQQALAARSPEAAQGQQRAISDLSGGVAGDDAFLRNAALKSGLEAAGTQGTGGLGSTLSPTSAGGVTAEKVYGSDLLNYRNMRDQQALGVANSLQPDAALNPSDAVSQQVQAGQQNVENQNNWNQYLAGSRLGAINNLNNATQQQEGATQGVYNANSQATNSNNAAKIAGTVALASAALGAVVL